jgi:hypothetical protein
MVTGSGFCSTLGEYSITGWCVNPRWSPTRQLNMVIHEVMHMVLNIPVTVEAKVVAISEAQIVCGLWVC